MNRIDDVNAPKTLELHMPAWVNLALLGFFSGVASIVLFFQFIDTIGDSFVEDNVLVQRPTPTFFAPGIPFGIAAMVPFIGRVTYWWPRSLLAAAACGVAHAIAFAVADQAELGVWGAGLIGAAITGKALLVLLGRPWAYQTLVAMVAAGGLVGLVFHWIASHAPLLAFLVYPVWQVAVAMPLGGLIQGRRSPRTVDEARSGPQ
jgi:hypothetical protein